MKFGIVLDILMTAGDVVTRFVIAGVLIGLAYSRLGSGVWFSLATTFFILFAVRKPIVDGIAAMKEQKDRDTFRQQTYTEDDEEGEE